ncbi:Low specificity L-threonine aldolase [Burkholderia sp. 8Y]|uniref:threonine aldolase family protein n=1 Tax=Burkholderia sp. 8Y TaxID=2653133 RepID=UPI0012F11695|nr:beta-eliminating lyase-related protein [Burkholderia sp. 8Y]VXC79712.1 Low specificity L-threonine aldolase [Burkholderia sp. 8Y]
MPTNSKFMLASDNASGVHPAVLERILGVNDGHVAGYGVDRYTQEAEQCFKTHFGADASAFMVCTGTAANVLALQALTSSVDAVHCTDCAHLLVDECGAPERMIGCKVVGARSDAGKINLKALADAVAFQSGIVHRNRSTVVSISQATERGSVYTPDEVRAIADFAHANGMRVHMDGARLANAAAAFGARLEEMTRSLGVDILSFGGTKNGLMMAEAIVVFDPALAALLPSIRKQGMQLASKQRFLAAQFLAYLQDDLWFENARHANRMAARLAKRLSDIPKVRVTSAVEANMVFATLPPAWIAPLQQHAYFHVWDASESEVRFVTSFDTAQQDIDEFTGEIARLATQELPQ